MDEKISWRYTPTANRLFDLHKSVGLLVGLLVVVRVCVRLLNKPQPLPAMVFSSVCGAVEAKCPCGQWC